VTSLVVFNMFLDSLSDGCIIGACRRRLDDDSLGDFTCSFVRNGDYSAISDIGVGKEMSLELGGCDL